MKSNHQSAAGFTIVELLVAVAVGGIILTAMSNIVSSYVHVSQRARYSYLTNAYIEAKVEATRNNGYNSLVVGTSDVTSELPVKLPRSKNGTVTITEPLTGLKQVQLVVTYLSQGKTISQQYTTYVGEIGVGQ